MPMQWRISDYATEIMIAVIATNHFDATINRKSRSKVRFACASNATDSKQVEKPKFNELNKKQLFLIHNHVLRYI